MKDGKEKVLKAMSSSQNLVSAEKTSSSETAVANGQNPNSVNIPYWALGVGAAGIAAIAGFGITIYHTLKRRHQAETARQVEILLAQDMYSPRDSTDRLEYDQLLSGPAIKVVFNTEAVSNPPAAE